MIQIAVNLRIPRHVGTWISVLYPNLWLGRPVQEWKTTLQEACIERDLLPEDERERRILFAKRDALVAWLATTTIRPSTKEEWKLSFGLAADMAGCFAFARGGYAAKNRVADEFADAFDTGKVDFERILSVATHATSRPKKSFQGRGQQGAQASKGNGQQGAPSASQVAGAASGSPNTRQAHPFRGRGRRRF
jgi:hypothetical protein